MDYGKIRREYIHEPLDPATMETDPMVMFQRWFDEAYKIFKEETNAMSLATAGKRGRPSLRTVLLKGVTENGFIFYTDYKSRKGQQLTENPVAAILFYWPGMDRQIRIEGPVTKISEELSEAYFHTRPIGSQISAAASPQSTKITLEELQNRRKKFEKLDFIPRPEHWGGFEVKGEYFEFWNGRENRYHDRVIYELSAAGAFEMYRIAP